MAVSILRNKSKELAKEIVLLCKELKAQKKESLLINQLLRAGTLVGEHIYEAQHIREAKDFLAKLEAAEKECYATEYWLGLLFETGYINEGKHSSLHNTCSTIRRMLTSSIDAVRKLERLICRIEFVKDSISQK